MIAVTKTFLPPQEQYQTYLDKLWQTGWITNNGEFVVELEEKLKKRLGVKHLFFVNNGTIAIQIAIKALELSGEIITTPFSYVATTSSISWENCTPVFADIDPDSLCLSPAEAEKVITPKTSAILATHVYGNACDVEGMEALAKKHNLRIIYDAAHAFDVNYKGTSLLNRGDISTLSFHATKVFHTIEGGAIITNDDALAHTIAYMRNFGHNGQEAFWGAGINGKNSEFNAAMGLCNLNYVDAIIARRKELSELYTRLLQELPVQLIRLADHLEHNYSYYPVVFESEEALLQVRDVLNDHRVFPRRYFYPSLNTLPYLPYQEMPVSESVSRRVMCLPLYYELQDEQVIEISQLIKSIFCTDGIFDTRAAREIRL